jgi:hypothetical protein
VWFQVHHPPLTGVLLIFRSRYLLTIGCQGVFSLGRWASRIQSRFHVTGPTWVPNKSLHHFRIRDCHPLWSHFPENSSNRQIDNSASGPATPRAVAHGLGCFHFARRYYGNRTFFIFHQVLRCFSSLGLPCIPMNSACNNSGIPGSTLV